MSMMFLLVSSDHKSSVLLICSVINLFSDIWIRCKLVKIRSHAIIQNVPHKYQTKLEMQMDDRRINIFGHHLNRLNLAKNISTPKMNYITSMLLLYLPSSLLKKYNRMIEKFIWAWKKTMFNQTKLQLKRQASFLPRLGTSFCQRVVESCTSNNKNQSIFITSSIWYNKKTVNR